MSKIEPEIRFLNFINQWVRQKFDDVIKSHGYKPYLKTSCENGTYPVIQQGDNPILGFSDGEPFKDYRNVILFGDHTVSIYKPKMPFFVATDGVKILSAIGMDGDFLTPLFEKYVPKPQGYKRHYTILKNEFVSHPLELEEQLQIGSFFRNLDDTISFHEQELEILKQTKQGFLQKMFPKEAKVVPEIRIEGFSEEWKSEVFSSIVHRISQQSNSDSLPKLEFEDIISGKGRLNKDISAKFDNRKGILFEPGYILFGKLRPYLKNWLLPKFKGIALGDFWVFTTKHSPEFVYNLIQTDKFQTVANLSTGTKMPRSDWKTVSSTNFLIPSIEEQIKIGEFFKQLDEVIELKEKEIEALKETKKGFLQKMFV